MHRAGMLARSRSLGLHRRAAGAPSAGGSIRLIGELARAAQVLQGSGAASRGAILLTDGDETVAEAGKLIRSFRSLAECQQRPPGERIVLKRQLPKIPERTYRLAERNKAYAEIEADVRKQFNALDTQNQGRVRFTLMLTYLLLQKPKQSTPQRIGKRLINVLKKKNALLK